MNKLNGHRKHIVKFNALVRREQRAGGNTAPMTASTTIAATMAAAVAATMAAAVAASPTSNCFWVFLPVERN